MPHIYGNSGKNKRLRKRNVNIGTARHINLDLQVEKLLDTGTEWYTARIPGRSRDVAMCYIDHIVYAVARINATKENPVVEPEISPMGTTMYVMDGKMTINFFHNPESMSSDLIVEVGKGCKYQINVEKPRYVYYDRPTVTFTTYMDQDGKSLQYMQQQNRHVENLDDDEVMELLSDVTAQLREMSEHV